MQWLLFLRPWSLWNVSKLQAIQKDAIEEPENSSLSIKETRLQKNNYCFH